MPNDTLWLREPLCPDAYLRRWLIDRGSLTERLRVRCREFAVEGTVVQIHPGPVVTTYEFKPDAGVKYNRITGLAEDLCLAMRAESILIERIPGKSTIGVEVPNHHRQTIALRGPRLDLQERAVDAAEEHREEGVPGEERRVGDHDDEQPCAHHEAADADERRKVEDAGEERQ